MIGKRTTCSRVWLGCRNQQPGHNRPNTVPSDPRTVGDRQRENVPAVIFAHKVFSVYAVWDQIRTDERCLPARRRLSWRAQEAYALVRCQHPKPDPLFCDLPMMYFRPYVTGLTDDHYRVLPHEDDGMIVNILIYGDLPKGNGPSGQH